MSHKIGVIPGDGIGHEVIPEALKVVRATGVDLETVDYDLGGARYLRDGVVLDDATVDEWRGLDALLLGLADFPVEKLLIDRPAKVWINQRPKLAALPPAIFRQPMR